MVFLWFSYGFPVVFLLFSYGFFHFCPSVFLWFFLMVFTMVFLVFVLIDFFRFPFGFLVFSDLGFLGISLGSPVVFIGFSWAFPCFFFFLGNP